MLRLPASPVGKSHHHSNKKSHVNNHQNLPEDIPSKKQKHEEEVGSDDDMEIGIEHRDADVVGVANDVASDPDFGSDSSNHGYSIATHFVKVQSSGTVADVKSLWQLAGTDAVSQSVKTLLEHSKPGVHRFSSIHAFEKVIA